RCILRCSIRLSITVLNVVAMDRCVPVKSHAPISGGALYAASEAGQRVISKRLKAHFILH
ncbi:hypothetical protein, partial [Endozoicomonas sp. ALB122]|uniref:hypothetical protein n=1 Tax=Endozoicomonas sp. ALB122 TaxID=3403075 RepID=UPI003BB76E5A